MEIKQDNNNKNAEEDKSAQEEKPKYDKSAGFFDQISNSSVVKPQD